MKLNITIGHIIQTARKAKKLSLKKFAELLGQDIKVVERFESNTLVPNVETRLKISKVLSIPMESLFNE